MTMAMLGVKNEDVKTAGSTMDCRVYYIHLDHVLSKKLGNVKTMATCV